jgi:hypothetical protein
MDWRRYMNSSDDEDENLTIPEFKELAAEPPPSLGPRYRPAERLPAFFQEQ